MGSGEQEYNPGKAAQCLSGNKQARNVKHCCILAQFLARKLSVGVGSNCYSWVRSLTSGEKQLSKAEIPQCWLVFWDYLCWWTRAVMRTEWKVMAAVLSYNVNSIYEHGDFALYKSDEIYRLFFFYQLDTNVDISGNRKY